MPIVLDSQKAFREVRDLPFCYLCCKQIDRKKERTDDHVPPKAIFKSPDRNPPLILPAHGKCNGDRSKEDQVIGQLLALLHGEGINLRDPHYKLRIRTGMTQGRTPFAAVVNLDLTPIIRRWVRGFHAALYKEWLPENFRAQTSSPLPKAQLTAKGFEPVSIAPVVPRFVEAIKRNRVTGTLDRIECYNGKCVYECVWAQFDNGAWFCIYCLNIYDWMNLGDRQHFEQRGCVGSYMREKGGVPKGGTTATKLFFNVDNHEPLNPFAN